VLEQLAELADREAGTVEAEQETPTRARRRWAEQVTAGATIAMATRTSGLVN
jgi:hypothetical protein